MTDYRPRTSDILTANREGDDAATRELCARQGTWNLTYANDPEYLRLCNELAPVTRSQWKWGFVLMDMICHLKSLRNSVLDNSLPKYDAEQLAVLKEAVGYLEHVVGKATAEKQKQDAEVERITGLIEQRKIQIRRAG